MARKIFDNPQGHNEWYPGWRTQLLQSRFEFDNILRIYRELAPQAVVEIGSWFGGTLQYFLRDAPKGSLVLNIDWTDNPSASPSHGNPQGQITTWRSWAPEGVKYDCLMGDSRTEAMRDRLKERLAAEEKEGIDFLFIDAEHTYWACRLEYELYGPLVRPGGIIVFHDIVPDPAHEEIEVWRFWEELVATDSETEEYYCNWNQGMFGTGVLRVGEKLPELPGPKMRPFSPDYAGALYRRDLPKE